MLDIDKWIESLNCPIKMIMQVHDELVFEIHDDFVDEASKQIDLLMSNCFKLNVPLIVDIGIGDNWDKAH